MSGVPRFIIDTDVKIYGLRVAGSTIIVVGDGKIVTWNLPSVDRALNARANATGSVRTAAFGHPTSPSLIPAASTSPDFSYVAITGITTGTNQVSTQVSTFTT